MSIEIIVTVVFVGIHVPYNSYKKHAVGHGTILWLATAFLGQEPIESHVEHVYFFMLLLPHESHMICLSLH